MRINDKKSVCIRFGNRDDVCCAPVTTWVFILSVLGRSNVLLSRPDTNFINFSKQYLAKLAKLHQRVS